MYYLACCCNCFRWHETSHTMPAEHNVPLYWYLQISENFKLSLAVEPGELDLKNVCQQCLPKIWCYVDTISINWQWSNYCSEIASYHWWCFSSMLAMAHSLGPNWRRTPLSSDRDAHHLSSCSPHSLQQDFPFRNKLQTTALKGVRNFCPDLFHLTYVSSVCKVWYEECFLRVVSSVGCQWHSVLN